MERKKKTKNVRKEEREENREGKRTDEAKDSCVSAHVIAKHEREENERKQGSPNTCPKPEGKKKKRESDGEEIGKEKRRKGKENHT